MKKSLTRIFSLLLAALTVMSVTAAPLKSQKLAGKVDAKIDVTTPAATAPAKAKKGAKMLGKARTPKGANLFKSARKSAPAHVKAPFKAGLKATAGLPNLVGSVIYSDTWTEYDELYGLYSVPASASQEFDLKLLGPNAAYGGAMADDVYYT